MMQRAQVGRFGCLALAFLFVGPWAMAQEPTAKAIHRAGQTFLTWQEIEGAKEYRVYRALEPIRDPALAACVGSADDDSTLNFRAATGDFRDQQQKKGTKTPPGPQGPAKRDLQVKDQLADARRDPAYHFVIEPDGKPLGDDVGLFVYTAKKDETAHYAVVTDGKIVAVSGPVSERVAMPEPVPQGEYGYVHWVDDIGTAEYTAMGNRAGYAFNFDFVPSREPGPQPLWILPHARGGNYRMGHHNRRPGPPHVLVPDDDPWAPGDVAGRAAPYFTMWHGYNTNCGTGRPLTEGVNVNYTERRLSWTIEWVRRRFEVDPARITMTGGSMGGIASVFTALRHPDVLAAIFANVPVLDFGAIWANNDLYVAPLWGKPGEKIRSWDGVDIYDTMRAAWYAENHPESDFPLMVILVGKNDTTVGWADKPVFFRAMESTRHGGSFYWDRRSHGAQPVDGRYWHQGRTPPPDMAGLAEKAPIEVDFLAFRRDRSYPAFSRCSLNDNPGDGRPESGAPHGQINGYLLWDAGDIVDTPTRWEMTLKLTPGAPRDECTVDVTPRRLQALQVAQGEKFRWDIQGGDSGEATADQWRLVTIPSVRVTKAGIRLRIEKESQTAPRQSAPGSQGET
ncbi:MAG: prolyl oligopeptidase family serine peptidase [Pirellulales bacterium]|nr:prolyl oligopeptidase family serine peptidase [Pirellulales bacterium]